MTKPSRFWFLNSVEQQLNLSEGTCLHLSSGKILKRFEINAQIKKTQPNNSAVYWLSKGLLKIGRFSSNGETLKYLVPQNQFFGEMALAQAEDPAFFATAVWDCNIIYINLPTANNLMTEYPEFRDHMLERISHRVKKLEDRLEELANHDSQTRVIRFLEKLSNDFGENQPGKRVVPNFLKNREIAQLTFTSRQTVNAVMNELKRKKQIDFDQKSITFLNPDLHC